MPTGGDELDTPLLQTKLYIPPPRPNLVPRPNLTQRLGEGLRLGHRLTLISAPAGFGKTTLVSEWVGHLQLDAAKESQIKNRIAWLSLDEGDNDLTQFLTYFIAALNRAKGTETTIGEGALGMLHASQPQPPPTEGLLTSLINEIAAIPDRIVLVLDDYHLIESSPVDASTSVDGALTFLLEHLPPPERGLHLAIATRDDPQLPLARLRARGQLTELRAADLRFSSSEAVEFLNQVMGLNLSVEDIAALETRTEGWIAGLQLAAISMQGHKDSATLIQSFTGSHRFVLDYLIEEVLEQQSESVQAFLLQTSVLDRMTGSLCDAVRFGTAETPYRSEGAAGSEGTADNSQAMLEMLERANLFIVPLDEERRWYRYHHLFADLLRQRLHQNPPPLASRSPPMGETEGGIVAELHRRASEWFEQNGFADEAIDYALRGEYFERAAYLIEDHFGADLIDRYERGGQTILRRWLAELPEELVFSKPHLCILHAWNLFTTGQLDAADRSLQAAEKMLDLNTDQELDSSLDKDQLSDTNRKKLVGRVAAIRSFLASYGGDIPSTIRYARQALEYLPEQELQWRSAALIALGDAYASQGQMVAAHEARSDALVTGKASGDTYILMIVNLRLAEILRQQGKLQQVIDICERQLKRADQSGMSESAVVGWLLGIWGEVLAELDNLDRAIDQAKKGVKLTARGGDMLYEVWSNLCLVRVLFSSGDITGAEDVIQSMENTAREHDMPLWALLQLSAWHVRIWLAQGKLEAASQWVGERELDPDREPTYLHEVEYIAFARILIAQGRLDEAARLLLRLLEAAEAGGRNSRVIEIMILQALAFQAGDDTAQAITTLEKALTLAEPGGFIRVFVDEGPPMARLLYEVLSPAEALSRGISPDYVRQLLAAFPSAEPEQTDSLKTQAPKSDLIEPLTERELEVLELIAEGLTNQEIATRLYISLNTVKVHTRNIYGKLGVNHRTQAVAQAQRLGLLELK
jgi:LuxR family maltose regulon positive regulatory protein